jgi:drug/metabolite transporter (DMT)-like permease
MGVLLTGITGVLYWMTVSRLEATSVGVIMYFEPASAVIWAALFLQETPGPSATLGVALVVIAGVSVAVE